MKKTLTLLATVAVLAAAPAFAQSTPAADPATVAATRQMLEAMKVRDLMVQSMEQVMQSIPAQMKSMVRAMIQNDPKLDDEQKQQALAKFEQALPKLMEAVQITLNDPGLVDEMIAEMVPLYARTYTTAEIRQLAAFYKSPLGQKMLAATPKLMAESMDISNRVMAPRMQKLMGDIAKSIAE